MAVISIKILRRPGKHTTTNHILVNRSPCGDLLASCRVDRFQVVVHDEAYDVDGLDEEVSDGNLTLQWCLKTPQPHHGYVTGARAGENHVES